MLGVAAGVGSLIGPAFGGLLATINDRAPFLAAAGLLLLTLVWGYFLLPESLDKEHRIPSITVSELNPLKPLASAFRWMAKHQRFSDGSSAETADLFCPCQAGRTVSELLLSGW
jgi:MFS family permease